MPMELRSRKMEEQKPLMTENDEDEEDEDNEAFEVIDDVKGTYEPPSVEVIRDNHSAASIKGDEVNILVLLFLYILQGIPLGVAAAIPLILTNKGVTYKEQAEFSFATWPFSIKLLWAPVVDSCFVASFGRRKTWLVPVQYLIGFTMLLLSANVDHYISADHPDVMSLTLMFFFLNFLAATQDIAVDGWALTMLQRKNVGYASTCNSVGQTAGYFLGYVFYIALESYDMVTLAGFLAFWGVTFLLATTLVAVFKHERPDDTDGDHEEQQDLGVMETYSLLWKIVRLPLVRITVLFLLTVKIGFSSTDAVTGLKLIEKGLPKEKLAMLAVPIIPLQIVLPLVISRYTAGPKPLSVFIRAMPFRLLFALIFAALVHYTPSFMDKDGEFPLHYYALLLTLYGLHQIFHNAMFVAIMAFFARISDPGVGGTYMTLLNTLANLGGNWPATFALWAVDGLTWKTCEGGKAANECLDADEKAACVDQGGECVTLTEGYYVESFICLIIGFLWLGLWGWRTVKRLEEAPIGEWRVLTTSPRKTDKEQA